MSINGVDITQEFGLICGSAWLVFYAVLIWFVWTRKPKTLIGRRWKAAWLIGGIPILGMPLLFSSIMLGIILIQVMQPNLSNPDLPKNWMMLFSSVMTLAACTAPLSAFMAVFSILGTYFNYRNMLDYWLDKIVPPSKDEKPYVWDEL
ncbi:MAG: hypothetical protein C4583_18185 [Anaerolineaceae bacterium]|nr:MAG: hypothetical protein C4583_18185 [Anaerolineaceae bacterium]